MSISFYLFCSETKQAVHVAEQSSGWFRGADSSTAVGMFCIAHEGKTIECTDGDQFELIEFDLWDEGSAPAAYAALKGHDLAA